MSRPRKAQQLVSRDRPSLEQILHGINIALAVTLTDLTELLEEWTLAPALTTPDGRPWFLGDR